MPDGAIELQQGPGDHFLLRNVSTEVDLLADARVLLEQEFYKIDRYTARFSAMFNNLSRAVVEEAVNEAFYKAVQKFHTFKLGFPTGVEGWLFIIIKNACIDRIRKFEREAASSLEEDDQILETQAAKQAEAWEVAHLKALMKEVLSVLGESRKQQEVLLLYANGFSHSEIADTLGINLGTVKSRIRLARERLQEYFGYSFADILAGE